ncbi:S9 family peptidase, partial [Actinoallomurus acaciae]
MTSLPDRLFRTRRFTRGAPGSFTVVGGGGTVVFLRGRTGDDPATCLWALDPGSGAERLLADPRALTGPSQGIDAYATDAGGGLAAFTLAGGLWAVDVHGGPVRRLPARDRA